MLGFQPFPEHEAESLHPHLQVDHLPYNDYTMCILFRTQLAALFWQFSIVLRTYLYLFLCVQDVNSLLAQYSDLHQLMDMWVILAVPSVASVGPTVLNWRLQAEREMISQGKPGLSDDQVNTFVGHRLAVFLIK